MLKVSLFNSNKQQRQETAKCLTWSRAEALLFQRLSQDGHAAIKSQSIRTKP